MSKTAQQWRKDINRSLKYQKDRRDEAARFQRAYTGDYNRNPRKKLDENKDEMYVNFVYSYIETIGPTIFSGEPKAFPEACNQDSEATVKNIEAVVNYWNRELGLREYLMLCRWDSFFTNAYFLTEWDFEEIDEEVETVAYVDPSTGLPVMGEPEIVPRVIKDQPLAKRLDPNDVILDPDSKCRKEDRWRGYRMILTKEEYQSLYPPKEAKDGEDEDAQAMPREVTRLESDDDQGVDQEWVICWKIYDIARDQIIVIRDRDDKILEEKDWPFDFEVSGDRFPITVLEAKMDPANPYGMSEFKAFWAQIQERNKIRTTIQSTTRRQHPGYLAKKGANDEEQLEKFTLRKIGEAVQMNNPDAIILAPMHQLPGEVYNFDKMSGDDLVNTSGFYEYNNDSIADTATEASLLSARGNIRKQERKQAFEAFIAIIDSKIAQLCQQFMDEAVAVQIKKPEDPRELMWLSASREQIQGEFNWTIKPGVMQHKDEGLRRQQTLKFAEIMAGNPQVDQRAMAEDLAEAFDYDPTKILRPKAEVEAEKQAAMQAQAKGQSNEKPPIQFSDIKWETLPPEVQAMVLQAAMQQNGVKPDGSGGGAPPNGLSATPSMEPPIQSMPGLSDLNQAPPVLSGQEPPPPNPVSPMSEFQGGPQGA
jgi:hypothetical protein